MDELGWTCNTHGIIHVSKYKMLDSKLQREETSWKTWENNIKMDLRKIVCRGLDWIQLVHNGLQKWDLKKSLLIVSAQTTNGIRTAGVSCSKRWKNTWYEGTKVDTGVGTAFAAGNETKSEDGTYEYFEALFTTAY